MKQQPTNNPMQEAITAGSEHLARTLPQNINTPYSHIADTVLHAAQQHSPGNTK